MTDADKYHKSIVIVFILHYYCRIVVSVSIILGYGIHFWLYFLVFRYPPTKASFLFGIANILDFMYAKVLLIGSFAIGYQVLYFGLYL